MYLSSLSLALNRPGAVSLEQVVASLFASGEQGAWYDPSAANVTWRRNLLTSTDTLPQNAAIKGFRVLGTVPKGVPVVVSFYVKRTLGAGRTFGVDSDNAAPSYGNIDTSTLPLNTWTRVEVTATTVSTASENFVDIASGGLGVVSYTTGKTAPDNTATATEITDGTYTHEFWGAQLERGTTATAYQRIVTPEITYLANVQSQPLLFQDSTLNIPVSGVEQPVGMLMDRRLGALSSKINVPFSNSSFDNGITGWSLFTATADTSISGQVTLTAIGGGLAQIFRTVTVEANAWYEVELDAQPIDGNTVLQIYLPLSYQEITTTRKIYRTFYYSTSTSLSVWVGTGSSAGTKIVIYDVKVNKVLGNHAYQTTSAARPVLRARYNLLEYSEQFDNAAWSKAAATVAANVAVAPDGTSTADSVTVNATGTPNIRRSATVSAGISYTTSIYIKRDAAATRAAAFYVECRDASNVLLFRYGVAYNPVTGAIQTLTGVTFAAPQSSGVANLPNSWDRLQVTVLTPATTTSFITLITPGATDTLTSTTFTSGASIGTSTVWGADLRVGTSAGDYQRIAAATDYATTSTITGQPFRPYLEFPSALNDDFLQTASIDFTGTDEMTACIGLTKTSDATTALAFELSANASTNNGSFALAAPSSSGTNKYDWRVTGTNSVAVVTTSSTYAAPVTNVVTGIGEISGDVTTLRVNKSQVATSASDLGTGNFGTYPLFIGRRNGSTNHFFGYIFGLIIRAKTCTAGELDTLETYLAGKAGLTL